MAGASSAGGPRVRTCAAAVLTVLLGLSCSPPPGALGQWLGDTEPADSIPVAAESLSELAYTLADGCGDSLDSACIAHAFSALDSGSAGTEDTPSKSLTAFQEALQECSCTIFRLRPQTYEAAGALMSLSVAGIAVVIAYPPGIREPLDPARVRQTPPSSLESQAEHLRVKLVRTVQSTRGGHTIVFHDGETVRGLAEDRPIGQVYPARTTDGADTYHQIGDLFWVARQPATTVEAHLDEWYATMAYTFTRPALVRLP
ncbi:MAG: hypothetical protein GF331_05085 [Chitinivibrionales bacterium]|nr:hypothetical protein [Chitinivibrionales bacterium]